MKIAEIKNGLSFTKNTNANKKNCKPKPCQNQSYAGFGIIVVENPRTQRALRNACRIIAAGDDRFVSSK